MRTILKVVDNSGKKGDLHVHTSIEGEEKMCKIGWHNCCINQGSPSKWKSQEMKVGVWCGCVCCRATWSLRWLRWSLMIMLWYLLTSKASLLGPEFLGPSLMSRGRKNMSRFLLWLSILREVWSTLDSKCRIDNISIVLDKSKHILWLDSWNSPEFICTY